MDKTGQPRQPVSGVVAKDTSVSEGARHFERTGSYRAEDVRRVLGDPRDHAELKGDLGLRLASWISSR